MVVKKLGVIFLASLTPLGALAAEPGGFEYVRRYKAGEKFSYSHRLIQSGAGRLSWAFEGRTNHEVVRDNSTPLRPGTPLTPNERVTWQTFRTNAIPGKVDDESEAARKVSGFFFGLPAVIPATIPNPMPSFLGQAANDLNRIYQIFNMPFLSQLRKAGDRLVEPRPSFNRWGDGKSEPLGMRCSTTSLELARLSKDRAMLRQKVAPNGTCADLKFPVAEMAKPLFPGAITNGYGIKLANGKLEYGWSTEETVTEIEIDTATGIILEASIETTTFGRTRRNCDANYQNCQISADGLSELPWENRRRMELRLLSDATP